MDIRGEENRLKYSNRKIDNDFIFYFLLFVNYFYNYSHKMVNSNDRCMKLQNCIIIDDLIGLITNANQ